MSRVHYDSAARQLAWLGQHARLAGVKLSAVSPAGCGLAAARDLAAGDVALSVPPQAWRPFSAAAAREAAGNAVATRTDAFAASLGAGAALADAALLALALAAQRRSESSPYVSALPVPDVPLLWPPPLRDALLRGTSAGPASVSQAAPPQQTRPLGTVSAPSRSCLRRHFPTACTLPQRAAGRRAAAGRARSGPHSAGLRRFPHHRHLAGDLAEGWTRWVAARSVGRRRCF